MYTHVALRNSEAFSKLGIRQMVAPGGYHTHTALDFPVSVGKYKFPSTPGDPAVLVHVAHAVQAGIADARAVSRGASRTNRYAVCHVRKQHPRPAAEDAGGAGFDASRDIDGITVNRWAHGYAYTPNSLFDPDWTEDEKPWVIGRQRFGNIAIANSDAGANAYTNEAIDQALSRGKRSAGELKNIPFVFQL